MDSASEADEKARKLTQQLTQSESEKHVLRYERDLFKEKLEEMRQQLVEVDRLMKAKHRECEVTRSRLAEVERERNAMSTALREREAIIQKAGLVLYGAESQVSNNQSNESGISLLLLNQDVSNALERTEGNSLNEKLQLWLKEAIDLRSEVKKYKEELDNVALLAKSKPADVNEYKTNATPDDAVSQSYEELVELQKDTSRQLNDAKLRLLKAQDERNSLEQQSARFEQQAKRYKQQLGEMETENEALKQERRRLQKEQREKDTRLNELEYAVQERTRQLEKLQKRTSSNS